MTQAAGFAHGRKQHFIGGKMQDQSYLFNAAFIDGLYENYLADPSSVSPQWRSYFADLQAEEGRQEVPHAPLLRRFQKAPTAPLDTEEPVAPLNISYNPLPATLSPMGMTAMLEKQNAVLRLINYFRVRGHEIADIDPLQLHEKKYLKDLDPNFHGLTDADLETLFSTGSFFAFPNSRATLREILQALRRIYCGTIGAEYMHLTDTRKKRWLQKRLEKDLSQPTSPFDTECKLQIMERLTAAEELERYLHTQYVGQKRFSLEGSESLIPLLDEMIQNAGRRGVREIIIGMAHRGRLNVLVNIMGKSTRELFSEFEGKVDVDIKRGSGDVKYHQGYSSDVMTAGGSVHLALAFNPSHLEIINPVVEGSVRARQERRHDVARNQVIPVLIHGDAAFSGQGVVMETLNLSQTRGYKTGGTLHIIINNQIGFTTSDSFDSRSTLYCTDVAKMVRAPIFHVNGDDPEAVIYSVNLALEYRMKFNMDVVVDLISYRRHGHNETDEPMATQPMMYQKIRNRPTVTHLYAEKLIAEGVLSSQDAEAMSHQYRASLKARDRVTRRKIEKFEYGVDWKQYQGQPWTQEIGTHISLETLQRLGQRISTWPDDFVLHRTVEKIMLNRHEMMEGKQPFDWGFAETMAYASLLDAGYPVRLSGQDSGRGTFAHRHSVLHNQVRYGTYLPLQHLSARQAPFLVINSLLSEEAVLGFEFGYASSEPETLTIWEAQFGDFANGAQVVIDQFISSSEAKWQRLCGLAMYLPHGYDGQGPEHSSARLERYLQLCAENNMQICIPSTPAQFFHLIRRQMLRPYRKPLIVFTPKSLLRHKQSLSDRQELLTGKFELLLDECNENCDISKIERVLLCSGQLYYKLVEARLKKEMLNVAILRVEQLYPFPRASLVHLFEKYNHVKQWFWVQEEPKNQGAWRFVRARFSETMQLPEHIDLQYAGRLPSASPAVGYLKFHLEQERELIEQAFDLEFAG